MAGRRSLLTLPLPWVLVALVLALQLPLLAAIGAVAGTEQSQPPPMEARPLLVRDQYLTLGEAPALARAPRIRLGVHLENAYNLSIPDQSFMADGWYWLRWPAALQARFEAEAIATDHLVEIVNNVEGYDMHVTVDPEKPLRVEGDTFYQLFRFSGHFYIDDLNLRHSPFNQLSLPLFFEIRPQVFALDGVEPVLLVPEEKKEGLLGAYASIKGYQEEGANIQPLIHRYPMDFGYAGTTDFAMTELRVFYQTPWFTAFLNWMMPLLMVMAVVFLAPALEASLGELRLAIPSTALLTLVVMQQTYRSELPPLPYLTFLDKVYTYCYIVSIVLFVLFVWGANAQAAAAAGATPDFQARLRRRIEGADRLFQMGALAGAVLLVVLSRVL
jgi:hypothetical protein